MHFNINKTQLTSKLVHIVVVDSGNIRSLSNAIKCLGHSVQLVRNAEEAAEVLPTAERVIYPVWTTSGT